MVQSSFPDQDQGEISGLSRSVSNLGSSLGTALVGSVLVAVTMPEGKPFAVALIIMLVLTLVGLILAVLIPRQPIQALRIAKSRRGTSNTAIGTLMPVRPSSPQTRHRLAGAWPASRRGRRDTDGS